MKVSAEDFNSTTADVEEKSGWTSVFAIDPGGISGWSWVCYENRLLSINGALDAVNIAKELSTPLYLKGEVHCANENKGARKLIELIGKGEDRLKRFVGKGVKVSSVCILENFVLRKFASPQADPSLTSPIRIAAKVDYALWTYRLEEEALMVGGSTKVVWQYPSAKGVITDDRLKRWGLWTPGKKDVNDANRHLMVYLRSKV